MDICFMLSVDLGGLVKKARLAKGLTQGELAQRANVSRSVLSRLEQGKPRPVQTDVLDRIFATLEVKPRMIPDSLVEERRRVRLEQEARVEHQRIRHLRLAVTLASNRAGARKLIARARQRVELWRSNKTCSAFYVKRWSALLALPPVELARAMACLGEWEDALFQNTPWSWVWT